MSADYRNEDSFQITIPSNASCEIYPNNKPNAYKIKLQKTVHLEPNQWEFAMVDIQFPGNWLNLLETTSIGLVVRVDTEKIKRKIQHLEPELQKTLFSYVASRQNDRLDSFLKGDEEFNYPTEFKLTQTGNLFIRRLNIYASSYLSIRALTALIITKLNSSLDTLTSSLGEPYVRFLMSYNERKGACFINMLSASDDYTIFLYTTSPYLLYHRFGYIPEYLYDGGNLMANGVNEITRTLDDKSKQFIARYSFPLQPTHPSTLENLSSIYVYSDLARYQLIGDTSAQLLAIIPLQGKRENDENQDRDTHVYYAVNPPYYMPVAKEEFNTVEIQLNTDWGQAFPFFENPNNRVICRLDFRRRNSNIRTGGQFIL